jgi:hypothetical protein
MAGLLGIAVADARADDKPENPSTLTVKGRLTAIRPNDHELTLRTRDGKLLTLYTDEHSKLLIHRREASLDRFQEGQRVRVEYELRGDKGRVLTMASPPISLEDVRKQFSDALESAKTYTYQQKEAYQRKMEPALRDLDERIDELKERAQEAGAAARQRYAQEIEELRQKREVLREKLGRAKAATPEMWEEFKSGVGKAWEDLHRALDRAGEKMNSTPPPDRPR